MDVFRNPDEVIKEVEDNEERREEKEVVEDELEDSPADQGDGSNPAEDS
jgi:hypothetical protein